VFHGLVVLSALLFLDVGVPLTSASPAAADGPFEVIAWRVAGDLRVGGHALFILTIRNRSKTVRKVGQFKSGGSTLYKENGLSVTSTYRNTPVHWRCLPARVLKPNEATSWSFDIDLSQAESGLGFLAFNLVYSYADGDRCVDQPFYWLHSVTVDHHQ
jgi:hypothetical protein